MVGKVFGSIASFPFSAFPEIRVGLLGAGIEQVFAKDGLLIEPQGKVLSGTDFRPELGIVPLRFCPADILFEFHFPLLSDDNGIDRLMVVSQVRRKQN